MTAAARRRTPRAGVRIVASVEVLRAQPPRLVDYDASPEEVTVELPKSDEWFEHVKLDARDQSVTCPLRGGR